MLFLWPFNVICSIYVMPKLEDYAYIDKLYIVYLQILAAVAAILHHVNHFTVKYFIFLITLLSCTNVKVFSMIIDKESKSV